MYEGESEEGEQQADKEMEKKRLCQNEGGEEERVAWAALKWPRTISRRLWWSEM